MKQIHLQEKEQFKKLFKQEYIDNFEDRFKILEVFLQTEKHVTVNELTELLAQSGRELVPEFVRETLKLMCRFGFAWASAMIGRVVRRLGENEPPIYTSV